MAETGGTGDPLQEPGRGEAPGADAPLPDWALGSSQTVRDEPELEESVEGWEVVEPDEQGRIRGLSQNSVVDAAAGGDEFPEDLMMACLHVGCKTRFLESGTVPKEGKMSQLSGRLRCDSCRLYFCAAHLQQRPLESPRPRAPSFVSEASMGAGGAVDLLGKVLGVPAGAEAAWLCERCSVLLRGTPEAASREVAVRNSAALASRAPTPPRRLDCPVRAGVLLQEASELLLCTSLAEMRASVEEPGQSPLRAAALRLLERALLRLRLCLRPWTEFERDLLFRLQEDLCANDPKWLPQFVRQTRWEEFVEASRSVKLLAGAAQRSALAPRDALQVISSLGRDAHRAVRVLGAQPVCRAAKAVAAALERLSELELTCALELLLDAAHAFGVAEAVDARVEINQRLIEAASAGVALRSALFWALVTRTQVGLLSRSPEHWSWAPVALEDLMSNLPDEDQLALLRQRAWVEHLQHGSYKAANVVRWEMRGFPLVVLPSDRECQGMEGEPRSTKSKAAPVIVRCRWRRSAAEERPAAAGGGAEGSGEAPAATGASQLLLKRDAGMPLEQQVSNTLRFLELLIWEDSRAQRLLAHSGLTVADVRVTYVISSTGPGTAVVEFVEGGKTLRDLREQCGRGTARSTLKQHIAHLGKEERERAQARLALTGAVSAVLSFVVGLGDRHHENFMVTPEGRLLHVDYGYALGREPLDSKLIHFVTSQRRPPALVHFDELMEVIPPDVVATLFWPMVKTAFSVVRKNEGLLSEFIFTAFSREGPIEAWAEAQTYVSRRVVPVIGDDTADVFIHALFQHCIQNEDGARMRDNLKNVRSIKEGAGFVFGTMAQYAGGFAGGAMAAMGSQEAPASVGETCKGLWSGARGLLSDAFQR